MIKKLRRKFIALSTISLLLLLGIIVVSSNLLTYRELVADADLLLDTIAENPKRWAPVTQKADTEKKLYDTEAEAEGGEGFEEKASDSRQFHLGRRAFSLEMMYEARFFTTELSAAGEVLSVSTDRIAMVDEAEAADYAGQAFEKSGDNGFIGDFRFWKRYGTDTDKYDIRVIFLDCGRKLSTFRNALMINCLISFLGFLIIFIVIWIVSGKLVQPVSEGYERQKQFIAAAGHEIRTPITIIDVDADLLSMEIGDKNEWLMDIRRQTNRMTALTNDLLALSRMDAKRQQFTMIDFPISDVVGETVGSFQTLAQCSGYNIRAEIAPMLSCRGDENSIRQVVGILLDNAIKYSVREEILLKLEKRSNHILLSVINHANPVSDEQLRHFFDRFYRTEQSRNSQNGGYGLGLSIAKALVEAHKGRITAAAKADLIRVTVALPAHKSRIMHSKYNCGGDEDRNRLE